MVIAVTTGVNYARFTWNSGNQNQEISSRISTMSWTLESETQQFSVLYHLPKSTEWLIIVTSTVLPNNLMKQVVGLCLTAVFIILESNKILKLSYNLEPN